MEITIKRLDRRMIQSMADIESVCFSMPWSAAQIERELSHDYSSYWAAMDGDRLAGYAGMNVVLDEGYITNVAVHPDYRRRRIGARLIERLIARANEMSLSFLTLEVRESNHAAKALYSGFGFDIWGVRPGYYQKPKENALLMTLKLQGSHETGDVIDNTRR